jgi:predicted nicotinamide N-methyase
VTLPNGLDAVEESLRRRFRVVESDVRAGDRVVSILHPASAEDLIDERDFAHDERLPYWAELWPSARILAERVVGMSGAGRSLLELGCGAGLVTTCAAIAGFEVVASDYYEDAVRFARVNAARNCSANPRGLLLDWRHLPTDLARFDVVLASDVLYERPYGAIIARVLAATLDDAGVAIVADPGRVGRDEFLGALPGCGLSVETRTECPYEDGDIRQTITIYEIRRSR